MSNKRMFSHDIVSSDAFLDMPISTQALYFHLAMNADDDGFVNPKRVMRTIGAPNDDLKVLIGKRFLLTFDTGVVVIKHWLIHNLLRADLYKETTYKNEKSTLGLNENGSYTELREGIAEIQPIETPKWLKIRRKELRTANVPQTALSIGKVSIGKVRLDKVRNNTIAETSSAGEYTFKGYIKKLEDSPRRELNIIALYLDERKPNIQTLEQMRTAVKRHLRAAKDLVPFTNDQILNAIPKAKAITSGWTIETLIKVLIK